MVKRSGATEPFSRAKVLVGVRKACQGRPVTEDDLALLAQRVEEAHPASRGSAEIDAHEVGLAVLGPLRELDEVAYLRFACVYQAFDSLEDFEAAIALLRAERDATGAGAAGPSRPPAAAGRAGRPSTRPAPPEAPPSASRQQSRRHQPCRTTAGTIRPRRAPPHQQRPAGQGPA